LASEKFNAGRDIIRVAVRHRSVVQLLHLLIGKIVPLNSENGMSQFWIVPKGLLTDPGTAS